MLPVISLSLRTTRERWLAACGTRPPLKQWRRMHRRDKFRLLHHVAARADDMGDDYLTPYDLVDIDDVLAQRRWSVEHVVPRSHTGDNAEARADPIGWIVATRSANSTRGNQPLVLWDGSASGHFSPPLEQRARLARKWLFIRATYQGLDPPSDAQLANAQAILALVRAHPPDAVERAVNDLYRAELGWANPLVEDTSWLHDSDWVRTVFGA